MIGCYSCSKYVNCKRRINGMRSVKKNHGGNSREDIRARIAAMEEIARGCQCQN